MKPLKILLSLFLIFACFSCSLFTDSDDKKSDPVQTILNSVNIDSLKSYVNILSGEEPVLVNDDMVQITSRHADYEGNVTAGQYLFQKLNSFGLTVTSQYYNTSRSILAIQKGKTNPDEIYIICAHYDCYPDSSIAPGADDNASGTAAVLEAARILSKYETAYTVIFALWDEEEQGVRGSGYYAGFADYNNYNILGVINIDMIGWDSNDDRTILINTKTEPNSIPLSDKALYIVDEYNLELNPELVLPGYGSDNLPFWYFGYSAIGIEEHWEFDWNDHYHTTEDKIDKFNIPYFHEAAKMAIGTIADLAGVLD